jgi:hypothetical protein
MDLEEILNTQFTKVKTAKLFNVRIGLLGGLIMGGMAAGINSIHGPYEAIKGGLHQFTYTFLLGGFFTGLCGKLSRNISDPEKAQMVATILPTILTTSATYAWHNYKGTAEPFLTTIPTLIAAYAGFSWWAKQEIKQKHNINLGSIFNNKYVNNRYINNRYTMGLANIAYSICK